MKTPITIKQIIKEELNRALIGDRATISVDGHPVNCDLALTDAQRMYGLMDRKSMGANEGMLFVFPRPMHQSFWMRDTYISLDVIFADEQGVVMNIEKGHPKSEHRMLSKQPAKFVLEVPMGWCAQKDVRPGSIISF
jgi:uncharacterized protein